MSAVPAIIGERYRERLGAALERAGISPLYLPDNPDVAPPLAGHADLSVFRAGNELILAPYLRESAFAAALEGMGYAVSFADIRQGCRYPADCALNACPVGDRLLCSVKITAREVLARFKSEKTVDFRQGYARCSICAADGESIITADPGIAAAAERAGLEVLRITPGGFVLPGYACGFIGGSSFKPTPDRLIFTGTLAMHPDAARIERFLRSRGVEPVYITQDAPTDIGGAIVL